MKFKIWRGTRDKRKLGMLFLSLRLLAIFASLSKTAAGKREHVRAAQVSNRGTVKFRK